MPMRFTETTGGTGYADIRVGEADVHQVKIDVSTLSTNIDADGYLPPGFPIKSDGSPVGAAADAYGLVGPEPVDVVSTAAADVFGNCIMGGVLNRDMIEDNLGRALSADELAGIASGLPQVKLI